MEMLMLRLAISESVPLASVPLPTCQGETEGIDEQNRQRLIKESM